MPVAMAVQHRIRDRLAGRDLHETRSAPLRSRLLLIPSGIALLILVIALAASGGSGQQPSAAAAGAGHHAAPAKVTVDPTRYIGQQWIAVRAALLRHGLQPVPEFVGDGASAGPDSGTVVGLAPTGRGARGTTITVMVARTAPARPQPKPKPPKPAEHVPPGHAKKGPGGHEHGD
jgi:hypothetical protein